MPNSQTGCPICGIEANISNVPNRGAANLVECRRCGEFVMTEPLFVAFRRLTGDPRALLPYLSAYTRQATVRGIRSELTIGNWEDLAKSHMGTPVSQKVARLLELVASRSSHPGDVVHVSYDLDYPLLDTSSPAELRYLLDHVIGLKYLQRIDPMQYILTVDGWQCLEPPKGGGGIPGRCFIAMSFHESLNEAYETGIRTAVAECRFEPVRIDRVHHNEKICDMILAEIRQCQFVVADFTLQRAGVYFEAGFAMGLGRPVIWMCREDDFENTHFDTRQYNHIVWTVPDDLRGKLTERIMATIVR